VGCHAESVCTTGHKSGLAEIQKTGVAKLHIQTQGRYCEVHSVNADEALEGVLEDEVPIHT
jgi:hypothetical protein